MSFWRTVRSIAEKVAEVARALAELLPRERARRRAGLRRRRLSPGPKGPGGDGV